MSNVNIFLNKINYINIYDQGKYIYIYILDWLNINKKKKHMTELKDTALQVTAQHNVTLFHT